MFYWRWSIVFENPEVNKGWLDEQKNLGFYGSLVAEMDIFPKADQLWWIQSAVVEVEKSGE